MIVAKQRHGPTGIVRLPFEGQITKFDNLGRREPARRGFEPGIFVGHTGAGRYPRFRQARRKSESRPRRCRRDPDDRPRRHRRQLARSARSPARLAGGGRSTAPRWSRPTPTAPAPPIVAAAARRRGLPARSSSPSSTRASPCAGARAEHPKSDVLNGLLPGTDADFVGARPDAGAQPSRPAQTPSDVARPAQRFNRCRSTRSIHIDTGMHRLGLWRRGDRAPWPLAASERGRLRGAAPGAADEPSRVRRGAGPLRSTASSSRASAVVARACRGAPASLADSSGIFLGRRLSFRSAAPGRRALRHQPAARPAQSDAPGRAPRSARILQVRRIDAVQTVGYGARMAVGPARPRGHDRAWLCRRLVPLPQQPRLRAVSPGTRARDRPHLDGSHDDRRDRGRPRLAQPGALVEVLGAAHGVDDARRAMPAPTPTRS